MSTTVNSHDRKEEFKDTFSKVQPDSDLNTNLGDDTEIWVTADNVACFLPPEVTYLGMVELCELESADSSTFTYVDTDDGPKGHYRIDGDGTGHHFPADKVEKVCELFGIIPDSVHEHARSRFDLGCTYPVVIEDPHTDAKAMIAPRVVE